MQTCPDCEKPFRGRTCKCGWEAPARIPTSGKDRRKVWCAWLNGGGQNCTMPAQIRPWPAPEDAAGYCGWHHRVREMGTPNTFPAFLDWQQGLIEARYCSDWTHYDVEVLWKWTQGEKSANPTPHACRRESCIVPWDAMKAEGGEYHPAPPQIARHYAQEIQRLLTVRGVKPIPIPVPVGADSGEEDW